MLNFKSGIGSIFFLLIYIVAVWTIDKWGLIFAGLLALIVAVIIVKKKWAKNGFSLLAFTLPLSMNINIGELNLMLPSEWLIGVLAIVLFWDLLIEKNYKLITNQPLPGLWVISFVLPLFMSSMIETSFKFSLLNALFVFVFFYGVLRFGSGELSRWLKLYFLAFSLVILWGGYQFIKYDFNPVTINGIFKPFYYSNTFVGAVAAILSGLSLGKARMDKNYYLLSLMAFIIVVFSESRAALISIGIMIITYFLCWLPIKARLAMPLILIVVSIIFGSEKIREAFTYDKIESHDPNANVFEEVLSVTNIQTDISNLERLNRWTSAIKMFQDRPHWGFGPGTYQFTYIPFQEASLINRLSVRNPDNIPKGSGGSSHSEILLQLSENGWPSTILFLIMFIIWMYRSYSSTGEMQIQTLPFFLGLITYAFHMNVNNFLNQPSFAFLFWSFGAAIICPELISKKNHK